MNLIQKLHTLEKSEKVAAEEQAHLVEGLRKKTQEYFNTHFYKGYVSGWKLEELDFPEKKG